jgi:hypothetical protein
MRRNGRNLTGFIIAHGKPRREFKDFKDFTKDPRKGARLEGTVAQLFSVSGLAVR